MNHIEHAIRERAAMRTERQRPGIQIDDLLALDKREADWELRWYHRHPWDVAAAYFRIEARRHELAQILQMGMVDDPSDVLANELRQVATACDDLGVIPRPAAPSGAVTMGEAYAWLDLLQQAVREYARVQSAEQATVPAPQQTPSIPAAEATIESPKAPADEWLKPAEAIAMLKLDNGENGHKLYRKLIDANQLKTTKIGEGKGVAYVARAGWEPVAATYNASRPSAPKATATKARTKWYCSDCGAAIQYVGFPTAQKCDQCPPGTIGATRWSATPPVRQ